MDGLIDYLETVHDALFARNVKLTGSFAFNKSAEQLQEIGAQILPTLEYVLREEVMPSYSSDPRIQVEQFPGAANLLVSYFKITGEVDMNRAASFFSSLHGRLLIDAIRAVSIVWGHTIPAAFIAIIDSVARTGSPDEKEIAVWSLEWHHRKQGENV